jgi:hypothetical protein
MGREMMFRQYKTRRDPREEAKRLIDNKRTSVMNHHHTSKQTPSVQSKEQFRSTTSDHRSDAPLLWHK